MSTNNSKPAFDAREMSRAAKGKPATNQSNNNSNVNFQRNDSNNSFDSGKKDSTTTHLNAQAQQQNSYVNINVQLNELIEKILEDDPNDPDFDEDRSLVDYTNPLLYQIYAENISLFSDNFNEIFFEELESSDNVKDLTELLIRDVNELWKFMYFIFRCLRSVAVDKECFLKVVEIIMVYSQSFIKKDAPKFNAFFKEMFISEFVATLKSCKTFEKKIYCVKLLYCFFENTYPGKQEAMKLFRENLKDQGFFIQSIGILLKEESELNDQNAQLIKDFQYYARYAVGARQASLRVAGFSLMAHLADLDFKFVQKEMMSFLNTVKSGDWWELKMQYLIVISKVLNQLVQSEPYQVFVKKQTQKMGRSISSEGDFLIKNIKEIFEKVANSFREVACNTMHTDVSKIALIYFSPLINENRSIASVYIDLLLKTSQNQRHWALYSDNEADVDEERYFILTRDSQKYKTYINNQHLKEASGAILTEISKKLKGLTQQQFGLNYIDLLIFCLENAEFDKLNVEILDGLINNSLDFLLENLRYQELCQFSIQILERYLETFLKGEALITEFEIRIGEKISTVLNEGQKTPVNCLKSFLQGLNDDYNEDSALHDSFIKFITKVLKRAVPLIENEEDKDWISSLFHFEGGQDLSYYDAGM